jgi:hypothetical protein
LNELETNMSTKKAILAKPVETALTTITKASIPSGPAIPPEHIPNFAQEAIRHRAYLKWEAAGQPDGDGVDFWLDAEQELLQRT